MRELKVYVEINGQMQFVGTICGNTYEDACFKYDTEYLNNFESADSLKKEILKTRGSSGIR